MTAMKELEVPIKREKFEAELHRVATTPSTGWHGTFAMVTLGVMFVARAISDVATAIDKHASYTLHAAKEKRN